MSRETFLGLQCIRCGAPADPQQFHAGCPICAARDEPANLTTVYDLDKARPAFEPKALADRPSNTWRYEALLPFDASDAITLEEGGTPLVALPRLARELGIRKLWVKDESRNPTWSFKDRSAGMAATHARLLGSPALVVSSTGNAAAAVSAYARRAGMPGIVLFAQSVEPIMSAFVRAYGANVVATPTKADRWVLMRHCVEAWGCYPAGSYTSPPVGGNPYMIDGYKVIGFEIWEQLGRRRPDWIFGPTGYTNCLFGVHKAFQELAAMGFVEGGPRIAVAEAYGSLSKALAEGLETVPASTIKETTVAISMGTAQNAYQGLLTIRQSNGSATHVSNDEIMAAQKLLAETEGIFGETAAATGLAALIRRREEGLVESDAEVVLVHTSTGLKTLGVTAGIGRKDGQAAPPPVPLARDVQAFVDILHQQYGLDLAQQKAPPEGAT